MTEFRFHAPGECSHPSADLPNPITVAMLEDRLRWLDEQVTERDGRITALEAALARAEAEARVGTSYFGKAVELAHAIDVAYGAFNAWITALGGDGTYDRMMEAMADLYATRHKDDAAYTPTSAGAVGEAVT